MVAVVAVETLLLIVLLVLVAGLLRSHAAILRRLGPEGDEQAADQLGALAPPPASAPAAARNGNGSTPAPAIAGATPQGDAVALGFDGGAGAPTLLCFLTSGCSTCAEFWETMAEPRLPAGVQKVIVTKGDQHERASRLRKLAPKGVPVVMSSAAWRDYAVPGAPYFVLVDGGVRGEGIATTWQALASLVTDAIEDEREGGSTGPERARTIDDKFAAAGIGLDHPSLYPGGKAEVGHE